MTHRLAIPGRLQLKELRVVTLSPLIKLDGRIDILGVFQGALDVKMYFP